MSSVLGHAHPDLVEALRDAAGRHDHRFSMLISKPVVDLAAALADLRPGLPRSTFPSTYGESVEAANRVAKVVTGKWAMLGRSEERRVGKGWVCTGRSRCGGCRSNKKKTESDTTREIIDR